MKALSNVPLSQSQNLPPQFLWPNLFPCTQRTSATPFFNFKLHRNGCNTAPSVSLDWSQQWCLILFYDLSIHVWSVNSKGIAPLRQWLHLRSREYLAKLATSARHIILNLCSRASKTGKYRHSPSSTPAQVPLLPTKIQVPGQFTSTGSCKWHTADVTAAENGKSWKQKEFQSQSSSCSGSWCQCLQRLANVLVRDSESDSKPLSVCHIALAKTRNSLSSTLCPLDTRRRCCILIQFLSQEI